jgi:protein dithiol oxidoreductase (disulfide-forming)
MFRTFAFLIFCVLGIGAAEAQHLQYQLLTPAQPQTMAGKVEVVEFFSYACPHCAHFHAPLKKWVAQLPATAVFVRVPVSFGRREWGQLTRAYYALEAIGELARVDDALFDAIHEKRQPLFDEESLTAWVAQQGVDAQKFSSAFGSQAVSSKAMRAEQMSRDYQISSVPTLVVAGKYVISGKTQEETLANAAAVVAKASAERKTASP